MPSLQTSSLLRQATLRLALSLLAALLLIGSIGWGVYAAIEHKATENETQAVFGFYENKLREWESQWESEALRAKSRLEFTRILEDPQNRWSSFYSYLTVQGVQQAFQNVLVSDGNDQVLFRFGPDGEKLPAMMPHQGTAGWHFDADSNKLFRVYFQDIWLGAQGMGHLVLLKQLDNALLFQNAYTHTDLFLLWQGKAVASSLGNNSAASLVGFDDGSYRLGNATYHQRSLKWLGAKKDAPKLLVRHKAAVLFSAGQLALGSLSAILALFGVVWGMLGLWLIRVSRRISALGKASQAFDADYRQTEEIRTQLTIAASGGNDEIDQAANSLEHLTGAVLQRDQERRAKEEALAESAARIREITESLADGVFVVGADGNITFVNPQATKLLGYRQEELLGRDSHSTLHHTKPDGLLLPVEQCSVHLAIIQGVAFHAPEDFFIRKDGTYLTASVSATPILRHGEIAGSVVSFQDIGERKHAEAMIKESEERLALATRVSGIGIWDWDLTNGQLIWDDLMFQIYGLSRADFNGAYEAWQQGLHPDDAVFSEAESRAALAGEKPYDTEFRIIRPDGEIRHVKAVGQVFRDPDGKPTRMVGINQDITEHKHNEKKITELLDFNSKIVAESTQGIKVFRADGQCVSANDAAARILEQDIDILLQENFRHLQFWETSGLRDTADEVLQENVSRRKEIHTLTPSGRDAWMEYDLTKFTSAGEPHLLVLIYDVTEFRRAEQSLNEARQVAERANRAKSEFLANMSHEIRTPMNAIIGLSDLALGLALPPKLRDYCAKIHSSSKALLFILNDILDYSKVEAGRLELDSVEFSLEEMLDNVANLFIVRAEEKGLELLFQIGHDVPPTLIGDPLRLSQVMNNLVGNAVKFTETGQVHIQIEQVAAAQGQASLRFAVRDSGIGMTREQVARLFHAFTQADGSITRKYGGTGLGLTISKRLVEKMGGDIAVSSELGIGSTFTFTLTLPVPLQARITRSPTDLRGMHVLVVDDLEISRNILSELLGQWGFRVSEAANGQEALAFLEKADNSSQQVELVLLDWKMPEMDGVELARRVHRLAATHGIPQLPVIIMVTAFSKEQLLDEAKGVQLDAVLTKPVTASGLFDTIIRFQGGQVLEAVEAVQPDLRERLSAIRGARILLVEDNEINQQVAQEFLERSGMSVMVAENGAEALSMLEDRVFDAVLMDLQMPVMDGLEATRRIRQDARFRELPIIAMTAAAMAQDREDCLAAGMNDHVAKPILPNELREALLKYIKPRAQTHKKSMKCFQTSVPEAPLPIELPGFALHDVLELLGGNRALLRKLLLQFAEQFADAAAHVAELLRQEKRQEAADYLHRIKGAAANLGATAVQQGALTLESQIQAGVPLEGEAEFTLSLAQALAAIATLGGQIEESAQEASPEECEKCQWQHAEDLARQLRKLLQGSDFIPQELMNEFKAAVGCQLFRNKLTGLQRQVDNFDYDNAQATLASLDCSQGHQLKGG